MRPRPLLPGGREGAREEGPRFPEPPGSHDRKADLHEAGAAGGGGGAVAWAGGAVYLTAAYPPLGPPAVQGGFANSSSSSQLIQLGRRH